MSGPARDRNQEQERERLHEALAAAAEDARPRPDCPEADEIWRAARGDLDARRTREIVDHAALCPVCTEAWDLAQDLGATQAARQDPSPKEADRGLRGPWLAAAAVLLLAVVLPFLLREPDRPRGGSGELTTSIPADALFPRENCRLTWTGPEETETYGLEVSWVTAEASGEILEVQEIPALPEGEGRYRVAPELLRSVPAGARLLWRVTARREGDVLASTTFTSRLD